MSEHSPRPEQSREEIVEKLREAIVQNQDVLSAVPEEKTVDEYWDTLKREGKPLHFLKTAQSIGEQITKRPVHAQTVHNELIKDNRFVLVGRGLYALNEWGYQPGIVRDVIKAVLAKHGPLSKDELIKKVLQERHVKENTILINLQNKDHFQKTVDGRFGVV